MLFSKVVPGFFSHIPCLCAEYVHSVGVQSVRVHSMLDLCLTTRLRFGFLTSAPPQQGSYRRSKTQEENEEEDQRKKDGMTYD